MRSLLSALVFVTLAITATAHTFPDQRCERTLYVRLSESHVAVKYKLELNGITMATDGGHILTPDDLKGLRGLRDLAPRYAKRKASFLADGLHARLAGGDRLAWKHREDKLEINFESENQFVLWYLFEAAWNVPADRDSAFEFEDQTFQASDGKETYPGKIVLTLAGGPGLQVEQIVDPRDLQAKSLLDLTPRQLRQLRQASALVRRQAAVVPLPISEPAPPVTPAPEKPGLIAGLWHNGLASLFDSEAGIGVLLLAAFIFGAGHAFTPGHGKTLVAAYLVGERGTIRHAVVLGLSTTLAHTGSVIGVAAVLWWLYRDGVPRSAQGLLQFLGGMLIFLVGLWLLTRRVAGKADHVHLGQGHHHHGHGHDHVHGPDCHHDHDHHRPAQASGKAGWWRVVLLGLGGGLIPCWDAVMLLFLAISFGRLGFAIPLLFAFSLGLAAVLVLLGIGVVLAHRAGGKQFGEQKWFQRLPVISAALLVLMGLWLARDGVQMLMPPAPPPAALVE